ncbi:MAG TPA: response regulator, partial [Candidatus Acidoferrum sp.]|nr:response regulator [Candidatus Acidoferrum sp.]
GNITVGDSPGGTGSVFRVDLPLHAPRGREVRRTTRQSDVVPAPQLIEELGLRPPARHPAAEAPPGSPVVLVVEDNPDMNAFIGRTLARTYQVVSAFDGQEGLQKALECHPDLILCDIMMPHMSGDQLVREVRRCRVLEDVPIVLLTAKVDDEALRVALLKDGAQDYLHKPVNMEHLLAKVTRLLADRRHAADELQRTRQVSARLLTVHDQERKRLAEELTENIAQCLTGVRMSLSLGRKVDMAPSPAFQGILAEGLALLQRTSREIRTMRSALHPALLDNFGLAAAVTWQVEDFAQRSEIAVTLDISRDLGELPPELQLALFRIMEEALANVRRHSGSPTVTVRIFHTDSELGLEVIDTGRGMPYAEAAETSTRGVGIPAMHERARALGGQVEILSGSGGTTVRVVLPLSPGTSDSPAPSLRSPSGAPQAHREHPDPPVDPNAAALLHTPI